MSTKPRITEKSPVQFTKWPLKKFMFLNLSLLCLVLIIGGSVILASIQKGRHHNQQNDTEIHFLTEKIDNMISADLPFIDLMFKQQLTAQAVRHEIFRYVLEDEDSPEPLQEVMDELTAQHAQVENLWPASLAPQSLERMRGNTSIMKDISIELLNIRSPSQLEELSEDARASADELVAAVSEARIELDKNAAQIRGEILKSKQVVLENSNKLRDRLDFVVNMTLANILLILILTAAFQLHFFKTLRSRLMNIVDRIKDIAEGDGDLTARLKVESDDETGQFAIWFNLFIGRIEDIILEIVRCMETLKSSSAELNTFSAILSKTVNEVSHSSMSMDKAAAGVNTNMESVTAATEQSSTNMDLISTATREMSNTITDIANNTIKARRITGEAGKGFAVVANEIKELAKTTSEATNEIRRKVEAIQESTGSTLSQISGITDVIDDVNETVTAIASAVDQQSVTTQEISMNIRQSSDGIREVNQNMVKSAGATGEIAKGTADITRKTNEISKSSHQLRDSAKNLDNLAKQLLKQSSQFKIS